MALVKAIIILQQFGVCLTYFVFVANNLKELVSDFFNVELSLSVCCLWQLVVYIPLALIRNIRGFAVTNMIANLLILYSLVTLTSYALYTMSTGNGHPSQITAFNPDQFYLFVGTSAFVYEGLAALVIPLQASVRPSIQEGYKGVFFKTVTGIIISYIIFAVINWMAYGDSVQTTLTLNLPDGTMKQTVQIAYCIAVAFSFPLQLFPAVQIIKQAWRKFNKLDAVERFFKDPSPQGINTGRESRPHTYLPSSSCPACDPAPLTRAAHCLPLHPLHPLAEYRSIGSDMSEQDQGTPSEPRCQGCTLAGNVVRAVIVASLALVAMTVVSSLDKLVGLLGAVLGIPLAFLFPVSVHFKLLKGSTFVYTLNGCVMVVAIGLCLFCTIVTCATWNQTGNDNR